MSTNVVFVSAYPRRVGHGNTVSWLGHEENEDTRESFDHPSPLGNRDKKLLADAELRFGSDAHVIQWARSEVLRIGQAENSQRSKRRRFLVGVRKR